MPNQNLSQSGRRRCREGLRLWKWEGEDADSRKQSSGKNCPGKSACLQAPGNQCPQLCCFPPVSSTMTPQLSAPARPTGGWGGGQDPAPRCSHWQKLTLDHYLKDEQKLDRGSGENQDDAAFAGETGRCSFPGHHPHRNTGREGSSLVPFTPEAGRCSPG